MATEKASNKNTESKLKKVTVTKGKIKSKVNYNVTVTYNKKECILAPRQELPISDFSKLGAFDPREVLKIVEKDVAVSKKK